MTKEEFLTKLRATIGPWRTLSSPGPLRQENGSLFGQCPIVAVNGKGHNSMAYSIGQELGLEVKLVKAIMATADNVYTSQLFDPILRQELLDATVNREKEEPRESC